MKTIATKEAITLQGEVGERTMQLLEHSNLLWQVKKEPLYTGEGIRTESFGIIRQDNQQWLGTVGNQYEVHQNWDLADTIVQAAAGIATKFRGGYIGDGEKVFIQVQLDDEYIGTDTVKRYITALNSHDGSTSIGFGSSNTVVICQNTFMRSLQQISKFRHTASAKTRIEEAQKSLRAAILKDESLMDSYKRMTEMPIQKQVFANVVKVLFGEDMTVSKDEISSRKANQMEQFNVTLHDELASHGETLWGLFNAVTYFENHIRAKEDTKLASIMTGTAYRKMNASYEQILAYVNEHTKKSVLING